MDPLSFERMAVRIEALQRADTHAWDGSEMWFRSHLPGGTARTTLPDPKYLRDLAQELRTKGADPLPENLANARQHFDSWVRLSLDMEGKVRDNDPRNPNKMIRDMAHGKPPRF